jgi:hypothetical protein
MTIRSRRASVTFRHPFRIRGIERLLPAGAYEVITDDEMIEGLTFLACRRIATKIMAPAESVRLHGDALDWLGRSCKCAGFARERHQ